MRKFLGDTRNDKYKRIKAIHMCSGIYIQPDFYCYFRKKKHQNIFGFGAFVFGTNHSWSTSIMLDQNTINNIYNNLVFPNFISSEDAFCFLLSRRALFQRSIPLFLFPMTAHSKFSPSTR